MTNKEIARYFADLAAIMELHNENPFKIKSYQSAYITLRKLDTPLSTMPRAEMDKIKGVGKAIGDKIEELLQTGKLETFEKYAEKTPAGVVEMLQMKGFGAKKVYAVWQDLGIESVGELLYACNENRLIELKGFGAKTQDEVRRAAEYFLKSRHKLYWATAEADTEGVLSHLKKHLPMAQIAVVGAFRRLNPVVESLDFLVSTEGGDISAIFDDENLVKIQILEGNTENECIIAQTNKEVTVRIFACTPENFGSKYFKYSGNIDFLKAFAETYKGIDFKNIPTENAIFEKINLPFIAPELREDAAILEAAKANKLPELIKLGDIKGVIHTHTKWSDGLNTVAEMSAAAQRLGYAYIGITDHSKAAFYANGLQIERVQQQWSEIDELNKSLFNFKILKGIECDILNDGSLDYEVDILRGFDFVIASVHSNLKMNAEKATARILKAIENEYVTILGHPTGRLLLSREGYPLDMPKIIDACAANRVAIELNAHPYRLDLDWTWIRHARERGVLISINPDAHSVEGINDIRYGINAARKGWLDTEGCLNSRDVEEFMKFAAKS